jgi:hypothetical protein
VTTTTPANPWGDVIETRETSTTAAETHPSGWWQASDGNWYPPETHPRNQVPPPQPPARKNPFRSLWKWINKSWKRRILVGLATLILLIGIASAGSSGGTSSSNSPASGTSAAPKTAPASSGSHISVRGQPLAVTDHWDDSIPNNGEGWRLASLTISVTNNGTSWVALPWYQAFHVKVRTTGGSAQVTDTNVGVDQMWGAPDVLQPGDTVDATTYSIKLSGNTKVTQVKLSSTNSNAHGSVTLPITDEPGNMDTTS